MSYYDTAQYLGDTGHALFDVAVHYYHVKQASRRLGAAVAKHEALYARSRAMSAIKLATLVLRVGDPVEGASIGHQSLGALGRLRSARTAHVVAELDRATAVHAQLCEVVGLRRDLTTVGVRR